MEYPTVHLNGTSEESLLDGFSAAHNAIIDAIKAMEDCAPNARDYYVNYGSIHIAISEHSARVASLVAVRDDIMELAEHVAGV